MQHQLMAWSGNTCDKQLQLPVSN